jgi:hypothetical protein
LNSCHGNHLSQFLDRRSQYLPGIEDVAGIERGLDLTHHVDRARTSLLQQELLLANADAVLTQSSAVAWARVSALRPFPSRLSV